MKSRSSAVAISHEFVLLIRTRINISLENVLGPSWSYGSWIYNYLYILKLCSNPAHGEVYSILHYVIKFVSDFRQVYGFLPVLRFPPPIKLTSTI
jgi:hypothetical protein